MTENLKKIDKSWQKLLTIAQKFQINGSIVDIQPYGSGNVNNTFLVNLDNRHLFSNV
jgi:hypothetical protein